MTEQEMLQRIKDESFVSTAAWVMLIFAIIGFYWSGVYVGTISLMIDSQDGFFSTFNDGAVGAFSSHMRKIQQQQLGVVALLGLCSLMLITTAVAVLKRRNWGRILMTICSVIILAVALFWIFYLSKQWYLNAQKMLQIMPGEDPQFPAGLKRGFKLQYLSYGIFTLLVCWALLRTVMKLNSARIRALFS